MVYNKNKITFIDPKRSQKKFIYFVIACFSAAAVKTTSCVGLMGAHQKLYQFVKNKTLDGFVSERAL